MTYSLNHYLEIVGLPLIPLSIKNKEYLFVVDTGSQFNLISSALIPEVESELDEIEGEKTLASGIAGFEESGQPYYLKCSFAGNDSVMCCTVTDAKTFEFMETEYGVVVSGILGIMWMQEHGFVIDFVKKEITINVDTGRQNGETE